MTLSLSGNTEPLASADAQGQIDAVLNDKDHPYWKGDAKAVERVNALYSAAHPASIPPPGAPPQPPPVPVTPAPTQGDSLEAIERDTAALFARSERQNAHITEKESLALLERRKALLGAKNTATLIQDDAGRVRKAPDPDAQLPVPVTEETLPAVALPPDIPADDPLVHAAREMAFFAEAPPALLQQAVSAAVRALETEEPSQEQLDTEGDAMTAKAQAKHGPAFPQWLANLQQGRMIAEADPHVRELLADPRVWNSLELAEALAHVGSRARQYYVRKHGTKRVA